MGVPVYYSFPCRRRRRRRRRREIMQGPGVRTRMGGARVHSLGAFSKRGRYTRQHNVFFPSTKKLCSVIYNYKVVECPNCQNNAAIFKAVIISSGRS